MIVRPIVLTRPILIVFWMLFIFFTTYGLLNLIVGCFCENCLSTAAINAQEIDKCRDEQRMKILVELRQAFEAMDEDHSGTISRDEFLHAISTNEQVMMAL